MTKEKITAWLEKHKNKVVDEWLSVDHTSWKVFRVNNKLYRVFFGSDGTPLLEWIPEKGWNREVYTPPQHVVRKKETVKRVWYEKVVSS